MASLKALSRLCSRIQPFYVKLNNNKASLTDLSFIKSSSQSQIRRFPRLPVELSSLETMLPLHSAIASARLQSSLSTESQSWCLVPQGFASSFLLKYKHLYAFMKSSFGDVA